jgi:hypothetical protein
LPRLFGFARMANFKAVIRLFRKFDQSTNDGDLAPSTRGWLRNYNSTCSRWIWIPP